MADYDAQPGRNTPEQPDLSASQREADEADLYASLRGVAGIVAGAQGVIDLLREVAEFAAQAIPGVDGAGVALIDAQPGDSRVQTWAATAVLVQEIDNFSTANSTKGRASPPCERGGPSLVVRWAATVDGRASVAGWPGCGCIPRCRCR